MPYVIRLKNVSGYNEPCVFCGDKRCEACPLPFNSNMLYNELLEKVGIKDNVSFYSESYSKRGKLEVIIDIVWSY